MERDTPTGRLIARFVDSIEAIGPALNFLKRRLFITPNPADLNVVYLKGRTGVVTGANVGLGFETARQLLTLGLSTLILIVRSPERGEAARKRLISSHPNAEVLVYQLDMSSYDSIQNFVKQCEALPRLDFAILNAGVVKFTFETNPNTRHEETIQVNTLSTIFLASLLLPVLSKKCPTGPGKITIVGSEVAEFAKFKEQEHDPILPQFDQSKGFDANERYNVSKLLLQYWVIEAAKRIDPNEVILNIANPGLCYGSNLNREIPGVTAKVFGALKRGLGRTCEVGARPLVKAAVVEGKGSHGKYYSDNAVSQMAPLTRGHTGEKLAKRVWEEIMADLGFTGEKNGALYPVRRL